MFRVSRSVPNRALVLGVAGTALSLMASAALCESVQDAGFESGGTSLKWIGGGGDHGISKEAARTGKFGGFNNGKWNTQYTRVLVSPRTTYTVTFWARLATPPTGQNYYCYLSQDGGKTATGQPITDEQWKQYKMVFTTGSNTEILVGIEERSGSSDVAYVDDFAIFRGGDVGSGSAPPAAAAAPAPAAAAYAPAAPAIPAIPGGLVATAGDGQVKLSWAEVSEATSYTIKQSTTPGSGYKVIAKGISARAVSVQKLANGRTYYYVVSAVGSGGEGADSAPVSATPTAAKP
jgi:hypothetical protein